MIKAANLADLALKVMEFAVFVSIKIQILKCLTQATVFENHRKSLIQHCERSELRLQVDKC